MLDYLYTLIWYILWYLGLLVGIVSVATFAIIQGYQAIINFFPQDLKKKYDAKWALVTGASSGIGKAIAEKLATQGINVVIAALDDQLLPEAVDDLRKKFPDVTFRKCAVNLGASDPKTYMDAIIECTRDIEVKLVFNNAGFILSGFFAENDLAKIRANYNCNAIAAIEISHHFTRRMISEKTGGFIAFTSSSGGYFPGPTATLYSCTKAMLTNFASTLSAEVRDCGIDVTVCHPSPVLTNFYKATGGLASLESAKKVAVTPDMIADTFFVAAGRIVIYDQGLTTFAFRVVTKILDFAFFHEVVSRLASLANADHKMLAQKSQLRGGKKD